MDGLVDDYMNVLDENIITPEKIMPLIDWVTLGGFIVAAVILLFGMLRWEH